MVENLKWYKIRKSTDTNPDNFFALGRMEDEEKAIKRLNVLFAKEEDAVTNFTSKGCFVLIEKDSENKEYPLEIIGEGKRRIAKVGS